MINSLLAKLNPATQLRLGFLFLLGYHREHISHTQLHKYHNAGYQKFPVDLLNFTLKGITPKTIPLY
jgi:hypothetical protein